MFAGQSRDELERLFWLALRAGEKAHVALALRAARDFGAGDFRAELLLLRDNNQQNEDEGCLYACAMSNDVATTRVLLQAARPSAAFGAPATMAAASTPQARRLSSADATTCCELLREPAAASGAAAQLLCKVAAHGAHSQKYSP